MLLQTYEEWKHCIEVKCGIPLTQIFVHKRIEELNDNDNKHTVEFTQLYGEAYKNKIVEWFNQSIPSLKFIE